MRINTNFLAALLALLFLMPYPAQSQREQRFRAGPIVGLTASQIDGDASAGYHKVGWQAGLRGAAILNKKQQLSIEILYTQRGNINEPKTYPYYKTTLDYIEVPVQWHYADWLVEAANDANNFYRLQFNAGLSYGRLMGYKDAYEDGFGIAAALDDLNENSFCVMLGATFYATKHVGFTFRWHRALNYLYKPGDGGNYENSLKEHFLAFQAMYLF